jgi:hypothetical protein
MGRGGFPPSETGSFSAHHTAQWVGFFFRSQVLGVRSQAIRHLPCYSGCNGREESREEWEKELIDAQRGFTFDEGLRQAQIITKRNFPPPVLQSRTLLTS